MSVLVDTLREHERIWSQRPLLRRIYGEWFQLVAARLARVPGMTVELGCGGGHFREVVPDVVETDVERTPWADAVVDAERMPYDDGSVANLVLVDVFHHLSSVERFLTEATRVLAAGGRIVVLDGYCSPLSTLAYSRFHQETLNLDADPFRDDSSIAGDPMDANIARTTLVFFRHAHVLEQRWPELTIRERRLLSFVAYPLSGGYSRRQILPTRGYTPAMALERALAPARRLLAFRCLVTIERR
jgi:SAM-dependent methyltransferase